METDRLILRELVSEDSPALSKVLCDPETMQHYPSPFDREQVERWIAWNIENYRKYHQGLWAMILKVEGICIGDCGITVQMIERDLVPEIGVHVLKRYWNKGIATEAAKACMDHAFGVLGYPAIYS